MFEVIGISVVAFLAIIIVLVSILLYAKARLLPSGNVKININGETDLVVNPGSTLLSTLGDNKILLPSACGGGGTCAMCRCQVTEGGGEILPTENLTFQEKSNRMIIGWLAR